MQSDQTKHDKSTRRVVGCMTGTSLDGIDAALVEISGKGLEMRARYIRGVSRGLGEVAKTLRELADQQPLSAGVIAAAALGLSQVYAEAVREVVAGEQVDMVSAHGQTVYHKPPVSWQLLNAPALATTVGVPVVSDLRAADLAAGGQGAPITPLADWVLFRGDEARAVVNLGGFCNMTLLPGSGGGIDGITGFDVCACNHVLDAIAKWVLDRPFDAGGEAALAGRPDAGAVQGLVEILRGQARAGRSLGTGDETQAWVWRYRGKLSGNDLASSACHTLADVIARRSEGFTQLLLAGGGAKNKALLKAISDATGARVQTTADLGVPIDMREAVCMAVLGALCQDRVPITLERVTGCRAAPVAGVWAWP